MCKNINLQVLNATVSLSVQSLSYEVARLPFAFILALITVLDMDTLFYQ